MIDSLMMTMRPEDVNAAMNKNGINQSGLARECGVSHVTVHDVLYGLKVSDRIRRAIAKAAGIEIWRIWPCYMPGAGGPRKAGRPMGMGPKDREAAKQNVLQLQHSVNT